MFPGIHRVDTCHMEQGVLASPFPRSSASRPQCLPHPSQLMAPTTHTETHKVRRCLLVPWGPWPRPPHAMSQRECPLALACRKLLPLLDCSPLARIPHFLMLNQHVRGGVPGALSPTCGSFLSWPGRSVPASVQAPLPALGSPGNLGPPPALGASPGQNQVTLTCLYSQDPAEACPPDSRWSTRVSWEPLTAQ